MPGGVDALSCVEAAGRGGPPAAAGAGARAGRGRARGAGAAALAALWVLAGCTTFLSGGHQLVVPAPQPVALEDARGPLPEQSHAALFDHLETHAGVSDILRRHLALEQAINADSPLVVGNRLVLLQDGPATYEAMYQAIRAARDHINLETYLFDDDAIGRQFAGLLLESQAKGVQVNVIYDSVGCRTTPSAFFDHLARGGIRMLEYNPINPLASRFRRWRLNNRDHRKLLVVDGRVAFVGGINISKAYSSGSSFGGDKNELARSVGWRDTHLQIEGPVVAEFQKLFIETWTRQHGRPLATRNYFPQLEAAGNAIVRALASHSGDAQSAIFLTLISAITHAERHVRLTNAYFVPPPELLDALTGAARRGVEVTLILPGRTDSWAAFHAGRSHYSRLLHAGVRIHERRGAVMHAKTATVDGVWSTVGSTNLDWRSLVHNDEINAAILDHDFARQMEAMFASDLAASDPVELERWQRRRLRLRTLERMARLLEYWL